MDKDKGVIKWSNEKWTCGIERTSLLSQFSPNGLGEEKRGEKRENRRERESVGFFRERSSTFSLKFPAIGPSASGEARSKVALHGKDYTWVAVLGSLDKLQKGRGSSPTCFTFCLRVM